LSFSPKRWWETPATPLESDPVRGRSLLACPAKAADPSHFPLSAGGEADITRYPFASRHEDFAVGVEADGSELGWTTVAREKEGDLFISLRNPTRLPVTMLWFSNGGRDYAPWNGRHVGCLGVEEGLRGLNDLPPAAGVPTGLALDPNGTTEVRHIIGCVPWERTGKIASLTKVEDGIEVTPSGDTAAKVHCDLAFLDI
jgi:hypothetical protein